MATIVEALYLFDQHNALILAHTYTGRPPSPSVLLPLYLAHDTPRPSLIYASSTNPPALIHSIVQDRVLFLAPTSQDSDPFAIITFLHRVADALEDVLGAPLLANKISSSYDVVLQVLTEVCDSGIVSNTEPNTLRDLVESPSWVNRLLGSTSTSSTPSLPSSIAISSTSSAQSNTPVIPWRRANVKYTSNELYVDIVEALHVILSPSGIPLVAKSRGNVVFTARVSGVPELQLILSSPAGGSLGVSRTVQLPTFHPCVRLNRWRDRPGDLSFVPPDGKFLLMSYEVDLLPPEYYDQLMNNNLKAAKHLNLPATVQITPTTVQNGHASFTAELKVNSLFTSPAHASNSSSGIIASAAAARTQGTSSHPTLDEITIRIQVPTSVRSLPLLKASRGEARWAPGEKDIIWKLQSKDVLALGQGARVSGTGGIANLKTELTGQEADTSDTGNESHLTNRYDYEDNDEDEENLKATRRENSKKQRVGSMHSHLLPSGVTISFTARGWLPSGLKVEKLSLDAQRSRGVGAGVSPYKGVKYICVSRDGVEARV
jgi:AP-3 complex subunit mu